MEETIGQTERKPSRRLWIDLLAGPVVWAVHFLAVYVLVEIVCLGGQIPFPLIERLPLNLIIAAVTLLAIGLVAWRGLASFRKWRGPPNGRGGRPADDRLAGSRWAAEDHTRFMALAGFLLSGYFFVVILLVVVPFLLLRPCGGISP